MSEPTSAPGPLPAQPPALEPVPDDGVRVVALGLVVWALALVACLVQRDALAARGATWWTWTAGCGLVVGAGLLAYCVRRARVYRGHGTGPGAGGVG
jgi:hypothetical protein